ncbi:MAG: hypothetical protein COA70_01665 [Planctomycetota bacterium]|nr:MAG: hypothetical protein COA70_01665 [Planctomycetota bacterium]
MSNPLLAKLAAFLLSLFPQLEGVRFLGQETGNFGGFDADVTAYERNGVPEILVRLHNGSEKPAWWDSQGNWRTADSWRITYENGSDIGGEGGIAHTGCSGSEIWGAGLTTLQLERDFPPSPAQLQRWLVQPGEYRFFRPTFVRNPFFDDADWGDVDLGKMLAWTVQLDMPLPVWEQPKVDRVNWVEMTFYVDIDLVDSGFKLDLRGKP